MSIRVGKILLLVIFPTFGFFFHTDQNDFKDCYAASGYAVMLATCLPIRGADDNVRLKTVCVIGEADIFKIFSIREKQNM